MIRLAAAAGAAFAVMVGSVGFAVAAGSDTGLLAALDASPGADAAGCWQAVAAVAEHADLNVAVRCQQSTPFIDAAGWWDETSATMTVVYGYPMASELYVSEVVAHELGHAYDSLYVLPDDEPEIVAVLGWPAWDGEAYADVFALSLGWWGDYGDGWRHPAHPKPNDLQIEQLRTAGHLPTMRQTESESR